MAVWNVILEVVGLGVVGLCWVVDWLSWAFRGLHGAYGCSCWCFIGRTWEWALVGLKTACLGGDWMMGGMAAVVPFILLAS